MLLFVVITYCIIMDFLPKVRVKKIKTTARQARRIALVLKTEGAELNEKVEDTGQRILRQRLQNHRVFNAVLTKVTDLISFGTISKLINACCNPAKHIFLQVKYFSHFWILDTSTMSFVLSCLIKNSLSIALLGEQYVNVTILDLQLKNERS